MKKITGFLVCLAVLLVLVFSMSGHFVQGKDGTSSHEAKYVLAQAESQSSDAEYKGKEACKMCHEDRYKKWKKSPHAKAIETLKESELSEEKCVKCHVTGFGEGGYGLDQSEEQNKKFQNVQCEACHGPGSIHIKKIMKAKMAGKEPKNVGAHIDKGSGCTQCHNPHIDREKQAKKHRSK